MALYISIFLVGAVLIVKGADWLTDGASALARLMEVSTLVIGLTVVAFGTSAPELVVSCLSAARGQSEMAVGNVVGSNIFNMLAIMGITAIVRPVVCSRENLRYDLPFCILASLMLAVMAHDGVSRADGVILLCFLALFLSYTFHMARHDQAAAHTTDARPDALPISAHTQDTRPTTPPWRLCLLVVLGLVGLLVGGELFVDGATGIATELGVSQSVIALTIVAAGTSLPELVTSAMAAAKGDTDMALGNVVGSCLMNIFMVLGAASCISPLSLGDIGGWDMGAMVLGSMLLLLFGLTGDLPAWRINRREGSVLLIACIAYYTHAVVTA